MLTLRERRLHREQRRASLQPVGRDQPATTVKRPRKPIGETGRHLVVCEPVRKLTGLVVVDRNTTDANHPTSISEHTFPSKRDVPTGGKPTPRSREAAIAHLRVPECPPEGEL